LVKHELYKEKKFMGKVGRVYLNGNAGGGIPFREKQLL
jgi:hypothetical protein